jgi:hypothetical protein
MLCSREFINEFIKTSIVRVAQAHDSPALTQNSNLAIIL